MSLPQSHILYTVEEYLEMERASEVRHEYLDGEIYEMSGESITHGRICTNIVVTLGGQLRGKQCEVFSKDMKIRSGWLPSPRRMTKGLFSYPDVVIVCGTPETHDEYQDILINPNVIIEVLSDATERFDRRDKFQRYRTHLPTLTDYILVSQNIALIELFTRQTDDRWLFTPVSDIERELEIASIGCSLRLADVYDRVTFPPAEDEEFIEEESSGESN
jgi:Uma2 family endonuclease